MTKDLEKRLHRLKQSYEKLPLQSDRNEIVGQLSTIKIEGKKAKKKFILPVPALVFVTFIFLGTVSTLWIINNPNLNSSLQDTEMSSTENEESEDLNTVIWAQQMKERIDDTITQASNELGLTNEQIKTLQYIQFAYTTLNYSLDLVEHNKISPEKLQDTEQDIMTAIQSPKKMLEDIKDREKLSLQEEQAFLQEYGDKVMQLSSLYNELLTTNSLQGKEPLLNDQGFFLSTNKRGDVYQYNFEAYEALFTEKFSPSALSYFEVLSMQPYFYAGDFLYSPEEMAKSLVKLETLLTNEDYEHFQDYELVKSYYEIGMLKLFTGTDTYKIKENNVYTSGFLSVLNQFIDENSVVSELSKTILQEIKTGNHSETFEKLTSEKIWMELLKNKYPDVSF
ncbi:hypothetical protein MTP04_26780 [Lysinibacillus sp. PLM2]|nr:hypothetical protein MTP04_26780 [Lysinibacillus sp. PLM2]